MSTLHKEVPDATVHLPKVHNHMKSHLGNNLAYHKSSFRPVHVILLLFFNFLHGFSTVFSGLINVNFILENKFFSVFITNYYLII